MLSYAICLSNHCRVHYSMYCQGPCKLRLPTCYMLRGLQWQRLSSWAHTEITQQCLCAVSII